MNVLIMLKLFVIMVLILILLVLAVSHAICSVWNVQVILFVQAVEIILVFHSLNLVLAVMLHVR